VTTVALIESHFEAFYIRFHFGSIWMISNKIVEFEVQAKGNIVLDAS